MSDTDLAQLYKQQLEKLGESAYNDAKLASIAGGFPPSDGAIANPLALQKTLESSPKLQTPMTYAAKVLQKKGYDVDSSTQALESNNENIPTVGI